MSIARKCDIDALRNICASSCVLAVPRTRMTIPVCCRRGSGRNPRHCDSDRWRWQSYRASARRRQPRTWRWRRKQRYRGCKNTIWWVYGRSRGPLQMMIRGPACRWTKRSGICPVRPFTPQFGGMNIKYTHSFTCRAFRRWCQHGLRRRKRRCNSSFLVLTFLLTFRNIFSNGSHAF
jgi:hypothetical protein